MNPEHHHKLERMYNAAPINAYFKPTIRIGDRECDLAIPIRPDFYHAANAAHGVVYFKAMDDSAFFAANSVVEDVFVVTASFNIYFIRPISEGNMNARARLVHASKNLLIAETVLTSDEGKEIGRGSGTFMRSRVPLTPEIGYK